MAWRKGVDVRKQVQHNGHHLRQIHTLKAARAFLGHGERQTPCRFYTDMGRDENPKYVLLVFFNFLSLLLIMQFSAYSGFWVITDVPYLYILTRVWEHLWGRVGLPVCPAVSFLLPSLLLAEWMSSCCIQLCESYADSTEAERETSEIWLFGWCILNTFWNAKR